MNMKWSRFILTSFLVIFSISVVSLGAHAQTFDQCRVALSDGRFSEAEACWRKFTRTNPNNADAYYYLGQSLRKWSQEFNVQDEEQKLDDAVEAYQKALQLSRNDYAWAWNGLANAFHYQDKSEEAIDAYRQALKSRNIPGPPTNAHMSANCNLAQELEIQGSKLNSTGRQSDKEIAEQKFTEAIRHVKQGIKPDPQYPKFKQCWTVWGDVLSEQRNYQAAIEKYRQSLALAPENAYAYIMWGRALGALGRLDEAIDKYRQATQIRTKETEALYAWAYVEWGEALWLQAQGANPNYRQLKISEAIEKYQKALSSPVHRNKLPTYYAFAHHGLGLVYLELGDLETAKSEFGKANEPHPFLDFVRSSYKEVDRLLQLKAGKQRLSVRSTEYLPPSNQTPIKRSVVRVIPRFWTRGFEHGTGWVIDRRQDRAWIVTNRHVIFDGARDAEEIEIEPYYGNVPDTLIPDRLKARVVNKTLHDEYPDLAVLEVEFSDVPSDVQPFTITSGNIRNNTAVSIVGNSDFSWRNGVIKEASSNEIILEPVLTSGNSGSPVLNAQNQVTGLIYTTDPNETTGKHSYAHSVELITNTLKQWRIPKP
ncbi:MAG: hypothetical protein B0A82_08820 [Alkalinema sp. CACIAM 70d]|nr:MAG: hypothetical protein B0A82_08820 [Alkalinema sp. CACIAM 70d]